MMLPSIYQFYLFPFVVVISSFIIIVTLLAAMVVYLLYGTTGRIGP